PGFDIAVLERESSLREHACGRERISPIIRAVSLNHKISVRNVGIPVLGGVIFELAVAPPPTANVISPRAGVDHAGTEVSGPHNTTWIVRHLSLEGGGWIALTVGTERNDRYEIGLTRRQSRDDGAGHKA